jgi:DNA invertase Pin-like site-specific DNA recombinase
MLTVLGGLAEFERELIRARTGEGRKRARERGVKFGAQPHLPRISGQKPSNALQVATRRPMWRGLSMSRRLQYRGLQPPDSAMSSAGQEAI